MIRKHAISLLGIVKLDGPDSRTVYARFPDNPADPEVEVPSYPESAKPGAMRFAWNRNRNHPYNLFTADNFAESILKDPKFSWYKFGEDERLGLMEAFLNLMATLKKERREMDAALSEDYDIVFAAVVAKETKAKNERRRRVCDQTGSCIAMQLELIFFVHQVGKSRMTISTRHPNLAKHLEQLAELGPEGNSSDEEDGVKDGVKCYGVIQKEWRSAPLIKFLRTVSAFGEPSSTSHRGSRMRYRYQSDRVSLTRAVAGLPINFYDAEWLKRQSAWELNINPVEYDLSLPEDVKKYVSSALTKTCVLTLSSGSRAVGLEDA